MSKNRYDDYDDYDFEETPSRRRSRNSGRRKKKEKKAKVVKEKVKATKDKPNKPKKKRTLKAKFFMILAAVLGLYCVAVLGYFGWTYINDNPDDDGIVETPVTKISEMVTPKLPERTTFLIVGVDDDGTRTDTIIVGCYNSVLGELNLISVPRDTLVRVDDDTFTKMNEEFPEPGQHGMKINAIHHYGGDKYGMELLENQLNTMLDTNIDFYVKVSFEAFDYLVDSIGGIEYNVPIDMDYDDPGQDLAIHLKAGPQKLNGKQAEGLVRFRKGYDNQDIGRVETQQNFIKEFLKQVMNADTIFSNPSAYINTFFKYITTDLKITDAIKYINVLKQFDSNKVNTYTLPGEIGSMYGCVGGYVMDEEETNKLAYDIFSRPSNEIIAERESQQNAEANAGNYNDAELTIQVLNGGYANGMATKVKQELEGEGYNVSSIGTYSGEKVSKTRIYVKEDGMGQQLKKSFDGCEVVTDPTVASEYDIVVVIGTGE